MIQFLKTTLTGGLVFLIPLTILIYFAREAFRLLRGALRPLLELFPNPTLGGVALFTLLTAAALIGLCFTAGLVAKTRLARSALKWAEEGLLCKIPGYTMMRSLAHGWIGHQERQDLSSALIRTGDGWQIGFVAETLADGRVSVFLPEAPDAFSGTVLLVDPGQIQPLKLPISKTLAILKRFGGGAADLIRKA